MACEPFLPGIVRTVNKDLVVQRLSNTLISISATPSPNSQRSHSSSGLTGGVNGSRGRRAHAPLQDIEILGKCDLLSDAVTNLLFSSTEVIALTGPV